MAEQGNVVAGSEPVSLSAHLSTLYPELEFGERLVAAARDGFEWVEFWDAEGTGTRELAAALKTHGLKVALVNVSPGLHPDDYGMMANPEAIQWWREQFFEALFLAQSCGARAINLLAGPGDEPRHWSTLIANVSWAVRQSADTGINLVFEPLNVEDRPGYLLPSCADVLRVIEELEDQPCLGLLFDAYHVSRAGADPAATYLEYCDRVYHVQIADDPTRAEPGTGQIDFGRFFTALASVRYRGVVGLEYLPASGAGAALGWRRDYHQIGLSSAAAGSSELATPDTAVELL